MFICIRVCHTLELKEYLRVRTWNKCNIKYDITSPKIWLSWKSGLGISIFENIDIPKLFSVIFWIPKYRNSSQVNFGIIPKYRNSIKANFGFSEIGNALRNHLISAPTNIQILMYSTIHYTSTLNEYALEHCISTAHSGLRIDFAIICQWLFFPIDQIHYSQCGAQVANIVIDILLRNLFALQCIV